VSLHPSTLLLAVGVWLAATVVTLAVATAVVVRLPPTYFAEDDHAHAVRAHWRSARGIARNVIGLILVVLGLLMSLPGIPGQGLLTVLIGLVLVDFPGRRRVEKALARRPAVLGAMNSIRARFGHPPLLPPRD
jgi:uncharacterized membrane protein YczE